MNRITQTPFILILLLLSSSCKGQNPTDDSHYTYRSGDINGIGKWYMGREIAYVMGYQGINWLERSDREEEEETTKLLKNMTLKESDHIADIGAGSGYHVFKMAPLLSNGKIYAVDIQDQMLEAINQKVKKLNVSNVITVKGSTKSVNLPENEIDKILMVDVYHEFEFPKEMISSIKSALKDDGEVYLIEYRAEDSTVPIKEIHKMSEAQAIKEMNAAGFTLKENINNLPWQHCMIFIKS